MPLVTADASQSGTAPTIEFSSRGRGFRCSTLCRRAFPVRHHVASEVDEEVLQALFEKRARELVGDPPLGDPSDVDCRLRVGKLGEIVPALFPYADAAPVDMGDSFAKCILRGMIARRKSHSCTAAPIVMSKRPSLSAQ